MNGLFRSGRRGTARAGDRLPILSAACVLILGACAAAPFSLRAADPAAPPAAASTPPAAAPDMPATPADGMTLQQCYEEALRNDPAIRTARANIEQALGQKIVLQSEALPRLGGGIDGGEQGPRYNTADPKKQLFILVTGSFSQPLLDVAIPSAFRLGRIQVAVAEQSFSQAVIGELYNIRISFYNALTARENIKVQENLQKSLQANYQAQQNQLAVGKVSHTAVNLASYQLSAISPGLAAARSTYRQARIQLAQRLGRDLGSSVAINGDADAGLPDPVGTLESNPLTLDIDAETAYALAHRPDLAALHLMIDAAQQEKNIAEAPQYPTIDLVANLQFIPESAIHKSGTVVQNGALNEDTQILYGVSGSWQVIDGGLAKANASQIQSQKESYQIHLKQLEDTVPLQLRQIDASLKEAAAQLQGSQENVKLAEENFRQVETQVAEGDLPQLDFLNAQSNLLQARFNRINALLENNTALATLDVVTGRYLEFLTPAVPASGSPPK